MYGCPWVLKSYRIIDLLIFINDARIQILLSGRT